ncbi:MAG: type IA DNA topoisomerase [Lachnospiraceae bacterium]|nr:type IA DNA topoisomerase [Lachnospiraceae bacterium]
MKALFIAEKPSVAREFAAALHEPMDRQDGYLESERAVVSWCVGHLVSMSYPEAYDPALKKWSLNTLPFIPETFRYEVIDSVKKQFGILKKLMNRPDIDRIYVCTDSGREGEYIYRLVEQEAGTKVKDRRRVWIDSQTEEEIRKGIQNANPLSAYDDLAAAAYLRAKEDYLMGINFSRVLAIRYGGQISDFLGSRTKLAVGRVMTCVLGMVVRREREIRDFVKTPFYRLQGEFLPQEGADGGVIRADWRAVPGSRYFESPFLYNESGFREEKKAKELADSLKGKPAVLAAVSRRKEKNYAPLLFNLAELQNTCSRQLKISPDKTLEIAQELYEKKLVTYPRTDARVLSTAVAKEIRKNVSGLGKIANVAPFVEEIVKNDWDKGIAKTRYTNDKMITDHYAIIPTGQGLTALAGLSQQSRAVYERIVRRFLSVFFPPAVYEKTSLEITVDTEHFFASYRSLIEEGYLAVAAVPKKEDGKGQADREEPDEKNGGKESGQPDGEEEQDAGDLGSFLASLKKGQALALRDIRIRPGETKPPKRYNSGSLILAMENAGQLIEDEEMRAQIKGSGIGTSATRAEILKKLVGNTYLNLNKKTQIVTPTLLGELIHDTVAATIRSLLVPELTANWEMGLTKVAEGALSEAEYLEKLKSFIISRVENVRSSSCGSLLNERFRQLGLVYSSKNPGPRTAVSSSEK